MSQKKNRLAAEKSPYLLQHAANPVDWYPWGDEAFKAAAAADKPIFLSIGYSTCHWCHVMERESFESEAIAKLMNDNFINIKVDREEHPDVDQIYMAVVQRMTGHGGWPMSVFMTPERLPFFAGTYFPPVSRYGQPGFADLMLRVAAAWKNQRDGLVQQAKSIVEQLQPVATKIDAGPEALGRRAIETAVLQMERSFDPTWGGFGGAPKFPRSMTLMLLLRDRAVRGDAGGEKLLMVEKTLEMMMRGGIFDQVGGGFARYSTDDRWLVPHFEKMLYDNALLVLAYVEAWQVSKRPEWKKTATDCLAWTMMEMTHPDGGFFSAEDADSEGEEGKFYVWTPAEFEAVLGKDDAEFAASVWDVDDAGNFEGKCILHWPKSIEQTSTVLGIERDELLKRLAPIRRKLYGARQQRVKPGLDDKILTSWNGLMIAAMARAGAAFGEIRYTQVAENAARFVESRLRKGDDGLLRRWRAKDAALDGTLEDYAFYVFGLIELFCATQRAEWLGRAITLVESALRRFEDQEGGGFFLAEKDAPNLIVRMKEPYDGATPSGSSVMAWNLATLHALTGEESFRRAAERTQLAFRADLERYPSAYPMLALALDRLLAPPTEIVVAHGASALEADVMVRKIRETFLPHAVLVELRRDNRAELEALLPWVAGKGPVDGKTAAYICRNRTCERPLTDPNALGLTPPGVAPGGSA